MLTLILYAMMIIFDKISIKRYAQTPAPSLLTVFIKGELLYIPT